MHATRMCYSMRREILNVGAQPPVLPHVILLPDGRVGAGQQWPAPTRPTNPFGNIFADAMRGIGGYLAHLLVVELGDFAAAEGRGLDAVGAAPNLACDGLGVLR